MTSPNRERIKELLSQAARLPVSDREAFIRRSCGDDSATASEAIDLLKTLDDPKFMSAPTGVGMAAAMPENSIPGESLGTRIDRYKLLQLIGEGGFGSVYMAEQTEPVYRRVALKIIKAGMDTRQVIARFEAERQALALMDHPNIARVFDAGATETGRPYFVMELVRGEPVTRYCDDHELSVRQRLELYREVCNAVQHAHQKGIIHRDLKPSNVLVTVADGKPVPKVIDFGIAKATGSRLTDKTYFTEMHQLIGTPEYMSPEQAEVSGVDIDTRSDVYSLGVMLYELLAGSTPIERERLRTTPLAEIQRLIREEEPPRPSLRVASSASSSVRWKSTPQAEGGSNAVSVLDVAKLRKSEPVQLSRILRGDLDWIVMKCLEKDRARRYETAIALSDDVSRYLANLPVLATPPSRTYKLRKFAARNKALIGAASAVALTLVLGTVVSAVGFWKATNAERLAVARSEESAREAAKATAVSNFLQEMLASANPENALGRDVTIRQALDDAASKIDSGSLKHQPGVEADLRFVIGNTYHSLGQFPEAERQLRVALSTHRSLLGESVAVVAYDLDGLANVAGSQGKYAEQESFARESLAILRRINKDDIQIAGAEQGLGAALRVQGKLAEAETHYRASLEIRRRLLGPEHEDIAQSLNSLALLMQNKGNFASAEDLFRESLAMRRKVLKEPHPIIADTLNNLANLLREQGKLDEAEPLMREALEMRRKLLGDEHPAVAQSVHNLANLLWDKKEFAEAESLRREALRIWRKTLPPDHPDLGLALEALGVSLNNREAFAEAEPFLREYLRISEANDVKPPIQKVRAMSELGESLAGQGQYADAEQLLLKAFELLKEAPQPRIRKETAARLAWLYELWKKPEEAAKWRKEVTPTTGNEF